MASRKARSTRKRQTAKGRKKTKVERSWWRTWMVRLLKFGTLVGVIAGIAIGGYLVFLDRTITKTFEGRRWSIPAQVYAQPIELHPGASLSLTALRTELKRLGYQRDTKLRTPGTFHGAEQTLDLYLRAFQFLESQRPSQKIRIRFSGQRIHSITSAGEQVPLIRLEPATIGSFFPSHGEDRIILAPDQVPPLLAAGLIAVEDRNYLKHIGFSLRGILRAFVVNVQSGERQQGGSTLTQQLVRSYFLSTRRTIERKLQEVAMSVILELRFSKQDLLTAYINEIFLGQNGARAIHGFGLGAQFYFNKPISELRPDEIATLVTIIRGPSYYNPFRHEDRVHERRDRILATFRREGLISEEEFVAAIATPLSVVANPNSGGAYYPAFMDRVRMELKQQYDIEALSSEGLNVFTTIKPRLQEHVQTAVSVTLNQIEQDRGIKLGALQGSAILADSQTGEVHALIGGRKGRVDGFNRALNAHRPIGSLVKPVVYLTALESGLHLASLVKDEPITIQPEHGEPWSPKNFDGESRGELPLVRALAESLNLATVNLGTTVGLDLIQRRFANLVGHPPQNRYPSFLLGAESLSPLQMLELYGNFASGGFRTPPKTVIAVLDSKGEPLSHHPFELTQTIEPHNAGAINRALEIVMAKGTGRSSPYATRGVAGKTGTSNDNRDSWFAGFDNRQVSIVWVGRDDNAVTGLTGTSGALRVWNAMMYGQAIDPLVHMPSPQLAEVEFTTGKYARAACADVVVIPVPDPDTLPVKAGCGVRGSLANRLRKWFE